jgi:hypothetical protein
MIMPVDFVKDSKLIFLRLEAAAELCGVLEVKRPTRFVALLIGPVEEMHHLYQSGRALATCLADDVIFFILFF